MFCFPGRSVYALGMATKPSRTDTVGKMRIRINKREKPDELGRVWEVTHPVVPEWNQRFWFWEAAMQYANGIKNLEPIFGSQYDDPTGG